MAELYGPKYLEPSLTNRRVTVTLGNFSFLRHIHG